LSLSETRKPEQTSLPADARALEAIARFDAIKSKSAHAKKSVDKKPRPPRPVPPRRRRIWILFMSALGTAVVAMLMAQWILGMSLREIYTRVLGRQIEWSSAQHPSAKPLWSLLRAPLVETSVTENDALLTAGVADALFPGMPRIGAQLPQRLLAPLLAGAKSGDTIILPSGRYTDCAAISLDRLTLQAASKGMAILDGGACEGKAAIVARGNFLVLDGLMFRNIRVPDGNGAGIRHERGVLFVRNATFYNNQSGILTHAGAEMELTIDRSRFVRNGSCNSLGGCAHSVYAGEIGKLVVSNSQFNYASGGHFLKSRSGKIDVTNSSFIDAKGFASYLIDITHGANGVITGNQFQKGINAPNRLCFIRIGSEGKKYPSDSLAITGNRARSDLPLTALVYNDTSDAVLVKDNIFSGTIVATKGASRSN
jgi:hypothetical protein